MGKLGNGAGMLFSGGTDCGQPLTQANRPSQRVTSICMSNCWLCTNSGFRDCKNISVAGAANFE